MWEFWSEETAEETAEETQEVIRAIWIISAHFDDADSETFSRSLNQKLLLNESLENTCSIRHANKDLG